MHDSLFSNGRSRNNQNFGKLLEQYVFCVANAFIEQADSETQQKLIRLFIDAGNEPRAGTRSDTSDTSD